MHAILQLKFVRQHRTYNEIRIKNLMDYVKRIRRCMNGKTLHRFVSNRIYRIFILTMKYKRAILVRKGLITQSPLLHY